ncbi:MAG: outer rane lipoprotein carrier protein LolA [Planctomycetota bacterium]|nr:outer rane lipoprotein carrier protein LolA [Planctomycetota bacterium]
MLKILASSLLGLMFSMGLVQGRESPPAPTVTAPPADPAAEKARDDLLVRWEKRTAEIETIYAQFSREDVSRLFGTKRTYEAEYSAKGMGRAILTLKEKDEQGGLKMDEQILLAAKDLYQFKWATHQAVVFPRPDEKNPDAQKAGLFNLSLYLSLYFEGFVKPDSPWLFLKVRAEDLKAKFRVELLPDRDGGYHLRLVPRTERGRGEFSLIHVLLDKETLLPRAVKIVASDGKETKLVRYSKITVNPVLSDDLFRPGSLEGWKVIGTGAPVGLPAAAGDPKR